VKFSQSTELVRKGLVGIRAEIEPSTVDAGTLQAVHKLEVGWGGSLDAGLKANFRFTALHEERADYLPGELEGVLRLTTLNSKGTFFVLCAQTTKSIVRKKPGGSAEFNVKVRVAGADLEQTSSVYVR
jgi:hypothetical protein